MPEFSVNYYFSIHNLFKEKYPNLHPNHFYDFLDAFSHFVATGYQEFQCRSGNINNALSLMSQLDQESHRVERKLDELSPTLQRMQYDFENLESGFLTKKEQLTNRRSKITEEMRNYKENIRNLINELEDLQSEVKRLIPAAQLNQKNVENIQENSIQTIRITSEEPAPGLKLLMELFCIFLDFPPSFERSGHKLLMDTDFKQIILTRVPSKKHFTSFS